MGNGDLRQGAYFSCHHFKAVGLLEQLRGEVERLVYSSEESGFTICRLVVPGRADLVTVAGSMPGIQPGEQLHLHLRGRWINHPIHGYQFRVLLQFEYTTFRLKT